MFTGGTLRSLRVLVVGLLLGAVVVTGCGDDEKGAAQEAKPKVSDANEPPDLFANRLAKLLETSTKRDCSGIAKVNTHSLHRFACPADDKLRQSMASFELLGAKEYGSGAVVDYESGAAKEGAAILLFVGPKRDWAISRFGLITKPSTKTNDAANRKGYDATVNGYLAAVRERDCDAFVKVAYIETGKKKACKTAFAATKPLAKRLKASSSAKPAYQGGNGTYGFYELETSKPKLENSTISVIKVPNTPREQYVVLDVASSPTSAEQRSFRQQFRAQQKQGSQVETSKSRKAK